MLKNESNSAPASPQESTPPEVAPAAPTKRAWMFTVAAQNYLVNLTQNEARELRGFIDFFNATQCVRAGDSPEEVEQAMTLHRLEEVPLAGGMLVELLTALMRRAGDADPVEAIQIALALASNQDGKIAFRGGL